MTKLPKQAIIALCFPTLASAEWCLGKETLCFGHKVTWSEYLWNLVIQSCNAVSKSWQTLFVENFTALCIALTPAVMFATVYWIIKGRPDRPNQTCASTQNQTDQRNNQARSFVHTNVFVAGSDQSTGKLPRGISPTKNNLAREPGDFSGKGDLYAWLHKVEQYLRGRIDKHEWFDVVYSWLSEEVIKNLPTNEIGEGEEGYEKLKTELIKIYGKTHKENQNNPNLYDLIS